MVKASKGIFNRRTRKLRGKSVTSVAQSVRTFNVGDKVILNPVAKMAGLPHLRYSGKHGVIKDQRGKSYIVEVADYKKRKEIIVGSVHLKLAP
jgi:large subunit ribosomal protein L21e